VIILERPVYADRQQSRHVVALFGVGLIGRSILASILKKAKFNLLEFPFTWGRVDRRPHELAAMQQVFQPARAGGLHLAEVAHVDVIWAAGHAGFGSTEAEIEPELEAFNDVLSLSERIWALAPGARHTFHLMSSAGGLFEGQRQVGDGAEPKPRRVYGAAKLEQEERLTALAVPIRKLVYRPSSVYGFGGRGVRIGLINALIQNAFHHKTSYIFGGSNTVRDYVLSSDIGQFVADRLNDEKPDSQTFLLASGKPTSTLEILHRIQIVIGRRLYLRFDPLPSNANHITFLRSALPVGWHPTDLETGIRQTAMRQLSSFANPQ
jgi:nucleoside-diphosphate-sugar epimerase